MSTINGHSPTGASLLRLPGLESDTDASAQVEPIPGVIELEYCRLTSNLDLAPLPSAVPCARAHARLVMAEWGLARLSNEVELLVSELVTNGVRASAGLTGSWFGGQWIAGTPPVRLWLGSECRQVLIQVWDGSHELPVRRETDPEACSGYGLLLVESLSIQWGAYRPANCSGKVIWTLLA